MVSLLGARVFVDGLSGIGVPESVSGLMREWKNGSGGCIQQPTTTTREREGKRKVGHLSYVINRNTPIGAYMRQLLNQAL
jgi:hypothetical protein